MKNKFIITVGLAGLMLGGTGFLVSTAQGADNKPIAVENAPGAVGKVLAKVKPLTDPKAKTNAKYYLCLYSASWCGPCRAEMPHVVKLYNEEIKKNPDIELILFSRDRNPADAKKWISSSKAKFPVLAPKDQSKIPGAQSPNGIPHLYIIDAEGNVIKNGHPSSLLSQYKTFCK